MSLRIKLVLNGREATPEERRWLDSVAEKVAPLAEQAALDLLAFGFVRIPDGCTTHQSKTQR